jgi:hypothetical protein
MGGGNEMHTGFWWGNLKARDQLVDTDVEDKIILKWVLKIRWEAVDWINLAWDRDRWWAVVN